MCLILQRANMNIFKTNTNYHDQLSHQNYLDFVPDWSVQNKFTFNDNKCFVMYFSRRSAPIIGNCRIAGLLMERMDKFGDLGVVFDLKLNFNKQINQVTNTAYRAMAFIIRNSKSFNSHVLLELYYSLVRSLLEFGSIIWSPITTVIGNEWVMDNV